MDTWISHSRSTQQTAVAALSALAGFVLAYGLYHVGHLAAGFLLGLLLLALGMAGLLTGGRQTITINPRTRQITVEDVTRLGAKTRCIGFDEIVDISIGYLGKKSNYVTCYYLMLKLKGGEEYSLFAPGRFYAGGSDRSVVEGWRDRLRGYVAS